MREAVNAGEVDFHAVLKLHRQREKFSDGVRKQPLDSDLLRAYFDELNRRGHDLHTNRTKGGLPRTAGLRWNLAVTVEGGRRTPVIFRRATKSVAMSPSSEPGFEDDFRANSDDCYLAGSRSIAALDVEPTHTLVNHSHDQKRGPKTAREPIARQLTFIRSTHWPF